MSAGIGAEFFEKSKYKYLGISKQQKGITPPALEAAFDKDGEKFDLPDPDKIDSALKKLINHRSSIREYQDAAISKDELSYLLWCTQGVKEKVGNIHTFRTVPSAGARHPLETFILVNKVDGLTPGLYRYLALEHKIQEFIISDVICDKITHGCLKQDFVKESAVTFIWVCVVERMTWRYGERGYRYVLLDAGHVGQNLYLAAESLGCGACAIGAFDDDIMNELLGLDGKEKFVIYVAAVGRKKKSI